MAVRRITLVVLAVVPLSLALGGAVSQAALEGGPRWYTYKKGTNCRESAAVDPINVVFFGRDATGGRTDAFVARYLGWGDATDSSSQGFLTPKCHLALHQRADGSSSDSRFHVRLRQHTRPRGQSRRFTVGDAHHEDHVGSVLNPVTGCGTGGHAVDKGSTKEPTANGSGFDKGRRRMASRWRASGRYVSPRFRGNTHPFEQCDGDIAGSDGQVAYMTIPKSR